VFQASRLASGLRRPPNRSPEEVGAEKDEGQKLRNRDHYERAVMRVVRGDTGVVHSCCDLERVSFQVRVAQSIGADELSLETRFSR
jgi:hypothetical protein